VTPHQDPERFMVMSRDAPDELRIGRLVIDCWNR
jgi:hypothetical protein